MAEPGSTRAQDELAADLNALCQGAVRAAAGDAARREVYIGQLLAQARQLRGAGAGAGGESVADFVDALAELLSGRSVDAALVGLVEPFRQGLRAVALDVEAAETRSSGKRDAGEAPSGPEPARLGAVGDAEDPSDWVAALAAQTVTLLRDRDREAARALVAELDAIRGRPGIDPDASAYMSILTGVLSGADVRVQALRLAQPYRDAYFSMQKLLLGSDPREALIERVAHNASLVLRDGGAAAKAGLGDVLEDLRRRAEERDQGELASFVDAVGRLVDADAGFDPRLLVFDDDELQAAWLRIQHAWSTPPPG